MIKLHDQLIYKINKSKTMSISMRLRLFMFLLVLVLTMSAGIIVILLVTGTFSAGISESKRLVQHELLDTSTNITKQYGEMSVLAVSFSKDLSKQIEEALHEQNLEFTDLSKYPDKLEELNTDLFEKTYYYLEKSKCSGAFFILDTTVNPTLENSEFSKAGLYLKNMEPNILSSSSPTFTLLHGFSSIGRSNSINLHAQWSMEFNIFNASYYQKPILATKDNVKPDLSKLYYWSNPQVLPGTSEEVMLCTVPLIDSDNNLYGVCGFEISAMLFKLSYLPISSPYTRMFSMLSPIYDNSISVERSMFSGGYSSKNLSKDNLTLHWKDNSQSFTTFYDNKNTTYLGYYTATQLYPDGSPFSSEPWITAILVPKEDIVDSITYLNIILICLLILLVTGGVLISIVFSNRYLRPISQGIEIIKSDETMDTHKTNVQEIDDLILYLAQYKQEVNQKAEDDKQQISLLETFVAKTKTLSPAERCVFNLYIKDLSTQEIADTLFLSINTIKSHNKRIFAKLGVASREEIILYIHMLKEIGIDIIP